MALDLEGDRVAVADVDHLALSPGPQTTRGPRVGKVWSQIFDDLYEQCSLHITENIPSP